MHAVVMRLCSAPLLFLPQPGGRVPAICYILMRLATLLPEPDAGMHLKYSASVQYMFTDTKYTQYHIVHLKRLKKKKVHLKQYNQSSITNHDYSPVVSKSLLAYKYLLSTIDHLHQGTVEQI